jgi:hypothetical protein
MPAGFPKGPASGDGKAPLFREGISSRRYFEIRAEYSPAEAERGYRERSRRGLPRDASDHRVGKEDNLGGEPICSSLRTGTIPFDFRFGHGMSLAAFPPRIFDSISGVRFHLRISKVVVDLSVAPPLPRPLLETLVVEPQRSRRRIHSRNPRYFHRLLPQLFGNRINPFPPSERPALERRDLATGEDWAPLAANIENLQVLYTQGFGDDFLDEPVVVPVGADPNTWVTGVRVTVAGRSASTRLEGASAGVVSVDDTFLRRSYTTTVSLRNQLNYALNVSPTP